MALNARSMTPVTANRSNPVVVELSDRRLPLAMRLDALRTSAGLSHTGVLRRILAIPGAMLLRRTSR